MMSLETLGGGSDTPGVSKNLLSPITSVFNLSVQFQFTEFPGSAGSGSVVYDHYVIDTGTTNFIELYMDASGFVEIITGPVSNGTGYSGTWVPTNGTHKVDYSIDALGVPTLFIDDVAIPLILAGTGFSILGSHAPNAVEFFAMWPTVAAAMKVEDVFVTAGNLPNTTVYCCP